MILLIWLGLPGVLHPDHPIPAAAGGQDVGHVAPGHQVDIPDTGCGPEPEKLFHLEEFRHTFELEGHSLKLPQV